MKSDFMAGGPFGGITMGENDKKEEEKSFVVRDRRFTAQKEAAGGIQAEEGGREEEEAPARGRRFPSRRPLSPKLTLPISYFL